MLTLKSKYLAVVDSINIYSVPGGCNLYLCKSYDNVQIRFEKSWFISNDMLRANDCKVIDEMIDHMFEIFLNEFESNKTSNYEKRTNTIRNQG